MDVGCEGLMRAGPSSSSAASAAATEAFEFQSRKRKHPLDKTSVKKQARHWLVVASFACRLLLSNY